MSESIQHNSESNESKTGEAQNRRITVDDRTMVVQELRKATLKKGCNVIQAEGVPNNVDRSTIMCRVRAEKPVTVKSKKTHVAEKMTVQRAFDELKGIEVLVHYTTPFKLQTYNGEVVAGNSSEMVLARPNNETMIARNPEAISAKRRLKNLREVPALEFEIESEDDQEVELALLFHARNSMNAPISHNLTFDDKENVIESLESNVDLTNSCGCDWSNVTLKIMTGKPEQQAQHRVAKSAKLQMASFDAESYSLGGSGGGASAESVGERKVFELPPGINLKNGDSKLIQLNLATSIPVTKEFYLTEGEYENEPAQLKLSFKNLACDKSCGMGKKPIAAGLVRVYQPDSSGSLQNTNDQLQMPDTPIGETVRLELGGTADIKGTRQMTKREQRYVNKNREPLSEEALAELEKAKAGVNNRRYLKQFVIITETYEVSIKNFKDRQVEVVVPHSLGEGQQILKSSFKADKSRVAKATVKVKARTEKGAGEQKLVYVLESFVETTVQVGDVS